MEKTYRHILLDLDGTLTDPAEGITKSVAYALRHFGVEVQDLSTLHPFIGPPLVDSFQEFYGFSPEQAQEALAKYREYFSVKGLYENKIYGGVKDFLRQANRRGLKLYLATSKPEVFARQILAHFGILHELVFVGGALLDSSRNAKADVIRYVLDSCHLTPQSDMVMVGDRKHDIAGARAVGIDSIGVLYGYGSREELAAAGATHIVGSVEELKELLMGQPAVLS